MSVAARFKSLVIAIIALFAIASCQRSGPNVQAAGENQTGMTTQRILSLDDQKFLNTAEKTELRQKDLAQTAIQRSKNGDIYEFAKQVVSDRNSSLAELTQLMKTKQVAEPSTLAEDIQLETADRLQNLTGDAFDDKFVSLIAVELQAALGTFSAAAETSADPDVRAYATKTLPSLRRQTDKASEIEQKLSSRKKSE